MNADERYFETKKAFQELMGEALKKRLAEIYTPEVIGEMAEIEQKYVDPTKRDELRRKLNREHAKLKRDHGRKRQFGPKKYKLEGS